MTDEDKKYGFPAGRLNNIDLSRVKQSREEFEKDRGHHYVEKVIQGEYKLDGSPAFLAEVQTDHTRFIQTSDEPAILGGMGIHTSPLTYVLFGTMACFASTVAIICAENQVSLKALKINGKLRYDIGPMLSQADWPLITELILEVEADKDITSIIDVARQKCPSVYAFTHAIKTEIAQVNAMEAAPIQKASV